MTPVFLDTVGILALLEQSDQWHEPASRAWVTLERQCRPLRTTSLILLECGNAVARKPYRRRIAELRNQFQADGTLIVPGIQELDDAWDAFERGEAGQAGIVDHISFLVMRRLGLREAFTNDAHFRAAGFETLF
jgi:predicted nucleic acid-binding protein